MIHLVNDKLLELNDKLLELSTELIITLRTWGFHLNTDGNVLLKRSQDTGKLAGGWAGQELQQIILEIRKEKNESLRS